MFFLVLLGLALLWLGQFVCVSGIAAPTALAVWLATKRKRAAKLVFALCLLLELAAIGAVAYKPFFRCPEEYQPYISEEEESRIVGFNSGVWNPCIPVFPVCVTVLNVDGDRVYVRTKYMLFGSSEMEITGLGTPELTASLTSAELCGLRPRFGGRFGG